MDPVSIRERILRIKNEALALIAEADEAAELERIRVTYLGRKGRINVFVRAVARLTPEQRKGVGRLLNDTKRAIESALSAQRHTLFSREEEWIDVTLPVEHPPVGHVHPVSQVITEITRIFERVGFIRVRYPEVEWDWYAFEALNMPEGHPARDEWETFFVTAPKHPKYGTMVLTPHTSSGQVREMQRVGTPPIRMINIAKCYRRQQDVTHLSMFHQFEGLVIDQGIGIKHLKGTIDYFASQFYGESAKSRLRPFHFSFTEPSFEVDFTCTVCEGSGKLPSGERCRYCKSGWHEVGGAGMVHPKVLDAGGIDSRRYTGFAFGWGVERAYTLKPNLKIDDIRLIYQNDLRFLEQF